MSTNLSVSDFIAACSAVIACLAFGITVYQGYISRKHNILSVRPFLDFNWVNVNQEGLYCDLTNHGLGTALLDKVTYFIDGVEENTNSKEGYISLFKKLGVDAQVSDVKISHIQKRSALAIDKTIRILSFNEGEKSKEEHLFIEACLKKLEAQVTYRCMYGKEYKTEKVSLFNAKP